MGFAFAAVLLVMRLHSDYSTAMNIPFFKQFQPSLLIESLMGNPWTYVLGVAPFCIFVALVVVFSSNAVNLTDGLDGLAIGLMVIAAGALTMLAYAGGHAQLAEYLQLARNPHTSELTIFCGSMTGASLGFLWYNAHPAEIFMGDVGSLGLGGAMAVVAVLIKQEVLLVFIGGVFVLEAVSVILQVGSFKLRRQTDFQDGAAAPSFRGAGVGGIEDHRALLDRRPGAGAVRADHVEAEMTMGPGDEEAGLGRSDAEPERTKTLVVGMKKSGMASAELLAREGATVRATDLKPLDGLPGARRTAGAARHSLRAADAGSVRGLRFDRALARTCPRTSPPLEEARAARSAGDRRGGTGRAVPERRTIGITGSNGKTTTTSLVGHILREAGVPVQVGGNIGTPVTAMVDGSRADGWNVLELSSFQLETIAEFRAHIGVALNVTQNHLDRHHTFENYAAAKGRLFETQRAGDFAVLNAEDPVCVGYADAHRRRVAVVQRPARGVARRQAARREAGAGWRAC